MFFAAITNKPIKSSLNKTDIQEYQLGRWTLSIWSDQEALLHRENQLIAIYENGIFAQTINELLFKSGVLIDFNSHSITIARAPESRRPVYYAFNADNELFIVSHITLLKEFGIRLEENKAALPEYFTFRIVMPPQTLYKDIKEVSFASTIIFNAGVQEIKAQTEKIYRPQKIDLPNRSVEDASQAVYDIFRKSVNKLGRYNSDTSCLLSGGVDSSALFSLAKDLLKIKDSYSTSYPFFSGNNNSEKEYALSASQMLNSRHHYYEPTSQEYLEGVIEAVCIAEQPVHHLQSVLLHLLMKNRPEMKKIIINGHGGGALFGNLDIFYNYPPKRNLDYYFFKILGRITQRNLNCYILDHQKIISREISDPKNDLWNFRAYGDKQWVSQYFHVDQLDIIKNRIGSLLDFSHTSVFDCWAIYSLLSDEGVTCSIWGKIEEHHHRFHYCPFYDNDLLNAVYSLPWRLKLSDRKHQIRYEIARKAGVPEAIVTRPKNSFGIDTAYWAKSGGAFQPLAELARSVFDIKEIEKLQGGDYHKGMTYWNVINYAIWKRIFIDNEPVNDLKAELKGSLDKLSNFSGKNN